MSKGPPYARVAITLPPEDLAAADRLAQARDRSRSWIVAEALRQYVAAADAQSSPGSGDGPMEADVVLAVPTGPVSSRVPYEPGLGVSRTRQLVRDLALTPEERVLAAEETLALHALVREERPVASRFFDHYDDFLDWKRDRDLSP